MTLLFATLVEWEFTLSWAEKEWSGVPIDFGPIQVAKEEGEDRVAIEDEFVEKLEPLWGKLRRAEQPGKNLLAAKSYARAASSAVSKVPSHSLPPFLGRWISATHLPHFLCLTPL